LFQPCARDPKTGYRKYRFDQLYQLASIRYMRKMGYSLEEIKDFLDSRKPEDTIDLLKKQSHTLREKWMELMQIDEAIQRKIQFVERKRLKLNVDAVAIRWFPDRYYIPLGREESLYMNDSFYLYPTIAFYEHDLKYFGAYLDFTVDGLNMVDAGIDPQITQCIPSGNYLVAYHKGPYEKVETRIQQLREEDSHHRLSICAINFNIIDQFVERDSENYITEIDIQILDDADIKSSLTVSE
jgi:DNA-binding transcriptional MerR regulator/effector-binding domain-containing protein